MHDFSILALVEAGVVKEDDDTIGFIQGISLEHARAVGDWLCLTTNAPVKLRFMSFEGVEYIEPTPDEVRSRIKKAITHETPSKKPAQPQ